MAKILTNPFPSVLLDRERIANVEVEDNYFQGRNWIEAWIVPGQLCVADDESSFEQYPYQIQDDALGCAPGKEARSVKFERGMHPTRQTMSLGQCDMCGTWQPRTVGACPEEECSGTIVPYEPFGDLLAAWVALKNAIYTKLMTEEVPDPDDFTKTIKLMDVI